MKPRYFNKLAIVLFMQLGMATYAYSEEHAEHKHTEKTDEKSEEAHERVQHGTHEHGKAKLTMAKTETGLEITLDTPAANIFGFGHKANSKEDHKIVQAAAEKLNAGDALFITNNAANCKLKNVNIESSVISSHKKDDDHDKHDDHKKDDDHDKHDDHKKNDDHEKHDDHKKDDDHDKHDDHKKDDDHDKHDDHKKDDDHDKHDSSHDDEETHSDVDATWVFQCEKPQALKSVDVKLFSQFPKGFHHLNIEWITSSNAGTTTLEADGTVKLGQ